MCSRSRFLRCTAAMAAVRVGRSEDEVGEKVDRCLADGLVKTGAGAALGVVFSILLFKRKGWPVAFGLGTGAGMALSNCQHEFRKMHPAFSVAKIENTEASDKSVTLPEPPKEKAPETS